jgi:hypothetical protein
MIRRRVSLAVQRQREAIQQQRLAAQAQREHDRAVRQAAQQRLRMDKARQQEYLQSRAHEADEMSNEVRTAVRVPSPWAVEPASAVSPVTSSLKHAPWVGSGQRDSGVQAVLIERSPPISNP